MSSDIWAITDVSQSFKIANEWKRPFIIYQIPSQIYWYIPHCILSPKKFNAQNIFFFQIWIIIKLIVKCNDSLWMNTFCLLQALRQCLNQNSAVLGISQFIIPTKEFTGYCERICVLHQNFPWWVCWRCPETSGKPQCYRNSRFSHGRHGGLQTCPPGLIEIPRKEIIKFKVIQCLIL